MNASRNEILIQNIIKCSAEAELSSAEIDLFLSDLILENDFAHKSLSEIKNDIIQKFDILDCARSYNGSVVSVYERVREKLLICTRLRDVIRSTEYDYRHLSSPQGAVSIAFWYSNTYAKSAFAKFEKLFPDCNSIPVDSFLATCEAIEDENTFGIIPIINSSDGRLVSFYRMMDKYDLKISAVCRIDNPNGDGFTKFALVGKHLLDLDLQKEKNFEFVINGSLTELTVIAELLDGKIREITSVPSSYSNTECINYISISLSRDSVELLWLYIYVFGGDVEPIGSFIVI